MITLTDKDLANAIGKEVGPEGSIYWKCDDLPYVKVALTAVKLTSTDDVFMIDGVMPYWLYVSILGAIAPRKLLFNSPNYGAIAIPTNRPQSTASGLQFKCYEDERFTLLQFTTPRTLPIEQLSTIIPPKINRDKGVVISSSAPFWIIATVAMAYLDQVPWIACTQKTGGAIIAISNDRRIATGTEIDKKTIGTICEKAFAAAIPRRGEVWLFDNGYGEHPALIISPNDRNKSTSDVLIVPFTSSKAHAHRHLAADPSMTGLSSTSFAQYSNITKLSKDQLIDGPIGEVKEELLVEIIRHVRKAIGDTP